MSPTCPYLFVYGTLRSDAQTPASEVLHRYSERVAIAYVRGRLYDLGRYPALLPPRAPEDIVYGELVRIRNVDDTLARLDRYEGGEYRRVLETVYLEDGRKRQAWLYQFARRPRGVRIASGDYLERGASGPGPRRVV